MAGEARDTSVGRGSGEGSNVEVAGAGDGSAGVNEPATLVMGEAGCRDVTVTVGLAMVATGPDVRAVRVAHEVSSPAASARSTSALDDRGTARNWLIFSHLIGLSRAMASVG
ncbi:MAG: hypothetical protein ACRDIY_02075 [Chloroflexota bacterium]